MSEQRRRPFWPNEPPMKLREYPSAETILMLARSRAAAEKRAEQRQAELQRNNPKPPPRDDVFTQAAERNYLREKIISDALAECDAADRALERELAKRRKFQRTMQRVREILGPAVFDAARAEARRRHKP